MTRRQVWEETHLPIRARRGSSTRARPYHALDDIKLWMLEDANPGGLFRVTPK
jgi:hypothetical protein